jgi:hypothetical protein
MQIEEFGKLLLTQLKSDMSAPTPPPAPTAAPIPPKKLAANELLNKFITEHFVDIAKYLSIMMSLIEAVFTAYVAHEVAGENIPTWIRVSMHVIIAVVLIVASLAALPTLNNNVIKPLTDNNKYKPGILALRVILGLVLFGIMIYAMIILPLLQFLLVANGYKVTQQIIDLIYSGSILDIMTVKSMGTAAALITTVLHYVVYFMMMLGYGIQYLKPEPPKKPDAAPAAASGSTTPPAGGNTPDATSRPNAQNPPKPSFTKPVWLSSDALNPTSFKSIYKTITDLKTTKLQSLERDKNAISSTDPDRNTKVAEIKTEMATIQLDAIYQLVKVVFNMPNTNWDNYKTELTSDILSGSQDMKIHESQWIPAEYNAVNQACEQFLKCLNENKSITVDPVIKIATAMLARPSFIKLINKVHNISNITKTTAAPTLESLGKLRRWEHDRQRGAFT